MAKKLAIRKGQEPWFMTQTGTDAEAVIRNVPKYFRGIEGVSGVIIEQTIQVTTVMNGDVDSRKDYNRIYDAEARLMNEVSLQPVALDFATVRETPNIWSHHRNGRHAIIRFNRQSTRRRQARAR